MEQYFLLIFTYVRAIIFLNFVVIESMTIEVKSIMASEVTQIAADSTIYGIIITNVGTVINIRFSFKSIHQ